MKVFFQVTKANILEAIALGRTGDTRVLRDGDIGVMIEGDSSAVVYAMFKIGSIPGIRIAVVEAHVTHEDVIIVE